MVTALRRLFREPKPAGATGPRLIDWLLALGFIVALIVEISVRVDSWRLGFLLVWPPLALNLLWRRTHPLHAIAGLLIPLSLFDIALARAGLPLPDIYSSAFGLAIIYSAFRWGSGRDLSLIHI